MIQVNEYYPCIQGEGVNTGVPMWLLRLQGCDVGCPWCDTKEAWKIDPDGKSSLIDEQALVDEMMTKGYQKIDWVMVTGGEPCLQNLDRLTEVLHMNGFLVSLETSGTEPITGEFDWIVISPKVDMPSGKHPCLDSFRVADEIKMPIGTIADLRNLEELLRIQSGLRPFGHYEVCLQPIYGAPGAQELCVRTCMETGYRLSLQTHKWIGAK